MGPASATDTPDKTDTIAIINIFKYKVFIPNDLAISSPKENTLSFFQIKNVKIIVTIITGENLSIISIFLPSTEPVIQYIISSKAISFLYNIP